MKLLAYSAPKSSFKLCFLFVGQIDRDDLEIPIFRFNFLSNFILNRIAGHQAKRGSAFGDFFTDALDKIVIDAVIRKLTGFLINTAMGLY